MRPHMQGRPLAERVQRRAEAASPMWLLIVSRELRISPVKEPNLSSAALIGTYLGAP